MSGQPFSGIVFGSPDSGLVHLPLDEVKVRALVVDGASEFRLSLAWNIRDTGGL